MVLPDTHKRGAEAKWEKDILTLYLYDLVFFHSKSKISIMNISNLLISIFLLYSCSAKPPKSSPATIAEDCLNYELQKVQLEGILYQKSFPGPPNYEDIKKGDKEEVYWLIKTTKKFCVNDTKDNWTVKLVNQSEVQLIIMDPVFDLYETKKSLLGKKVMVKGTLFPQMSGHHKTEVLITVESLEKAYE